MRLKIKFCPVCGFRFIRPTALAYLNGSIWWTTKREGSSDLVVWYRCPLCKGTAVVTPRFETFVDPFTVKRCWSI